MCVRSSTFTAQTLNSASSQVVLENETDGHAQRSNKHPALYNRTSTASNPYAAIKAHPHDPLEPLAAGNLVSYAGSPTSPPQSSTAYLPGAGTARLICCWLHEVITWRTLHIVVVTHRVSTSVLLFAFIRREQFDPTPLFLPNCSDLQACHAADNMYSCAVRR